MGASRVQPFAEPTGNRQSAPSTRASSGVTIAGTPVTKEGCVSIIGAHALFGAIRQVAPAAAVPRAAD
jgi:hypothetical protein